MHFENNEHFASMRRTPRETLTFAAMAVVATLAMTLLAVQPARAVDANHACADAATTHAELQR